MREEVRRIQRVIEDYLQFARLPKPQLRPVELNELLGQKLDFMRGEFERARVKPLHSFRSGAGNHQRRRRTIVAGGAESDPQQSGRHARRRRTDRGHLARRRTGAPCGSRDTGKGMSAEQLKQVFAPFFTTKPERHRPRAGARPTNHQRTRRPR